MTLLLPLGSHDEHATCVCVSEHRPPALELNAHHILPLYLGGPDVPDNLVWLCPTTHANVHEVMRLLLRDHVLYSYRQVQALSTRPVARYSYDLAAEGYRRWLATQPPA